MKLLVFGDFHEGNQVPKARIDDYYQTKIELIQEIDEIAKTYDCKAKLQLGDFLDKSKYSNEVLTDIIRRWKPTAPNQQLQRLQNGEITPEEFLTLIKDDIPMIGVVGNHELIGNSLNSLKQTSIYMLQEMGFMRLVDKENPVYLTDEETGQVIAITGAPYHIHRDKPKYVGDYIIDEKLGDVHIHLVHGNGINKAIKPQHTTVDKFLYDTQADVTIMGHYHKGFPIVEHEGKYAFNPGSPQLLTADEIGRKPQVAILDITKDKIDIKLIPLKTGADSTKVLSRDHIEEAENKKRKMEEIKSTVSQAEIEQRLSIKDILTDLMDNQKIEPEIRKDLIERIEQKMNMIDSVHHQTEPYTIETIELVNFQSHKHTVIDCHPKLNVFVGESGHGKTAIQRALSFVFEGKKGGKNFIHKGEKECSVTLRLSNGNKVTRFIKSNGKTSGYKLFDAKKGTLEEGNTNLLPRVQEMLGFFPLTIDEGLSVPLNFLKQGSSWYFIGDNMTAPNRAKVIGSFFQTHYADAVAKECENESKVVGKELKKLDERVEKIEEELINYNYLDALEECLGLIDQKQQRLEHLCEKFKQAKQAHEQLLIQQAKEKRYLQLLMKLNQNLNQTQAKIERLKANIQRFKDLERVQKIHIQSLKLSVFEQRLIIALQTVQTNIIEPKQKLNELKNKIERFQRIKEIHQQYIHTLLCHQHYEKLLSQLSEVNDWKMKHSYLKQHVSIFQLKEQQVKYGLNKVYDQKKLSRDIQLIETCLKQVPSSEEVRGKFKSLIENYQRSIGLTTSFRRYAERRNELISQGNQITQTLATNQQNLQKHLESYRLLLTQVKQCPTCHSDLSEQSIERMVHHIIAKHSC